MSIDAKNYRFFISHKVVGVEANKKKYEVKLNNQDTASIMHHMLGLVKPGIISEISNILSKCIFKNDYQVVEIPKQIFAKYGYDVMLVADRFSCFISKCYAHNVANYSLFFSYSECECSLISVLKNEDTEAIGEIDDLDDTMIFAL
jgi:hypothetical protein